MKNCNTFQNQPTQHMLPIAHVTAFAAICMLSQFAHADQITPPPVPTDIQVPAGNKVFFVGHAKGTQNYICLPSGEGFKFTLFTPQATLFNDFDKQVTTHYFSPNPSEEGVIRATWQHSRDTSTFWGRVSKSYSEPDFVDPNAIPWLLIEKSGSADGPTGGHQLTDTTYIQRVNTSGGVATSTNCAMAADVGKQEFVPYTADYFFYKKAHKRDAAQDN